jgi:hypothetical protein
MEPLDIPVDIDGGQEKILREVKAFSKVWTN